MVVEIHLMVILDVLLFLCFVPLKQIVYQFNCYIINFCGVFEHNNYQ